MTLAGIALFLISGGLLAGIYLVLLWITVERIARSKSPLVLLGLSAVFRLALLLAAFAFISGFDWKRLALCFTGFVITRFVVTRILVPQQETKENTGAVQS